MALLPDILEPAWLEENSRIANSAPREYLFWDMRQSPDEMKQITGYFGLIYRPESGQITHNLVTALIGPDGRIARLYQGNQWNAAQILAELR